MNTTEIVALASVLVSVGMNTALYIHLSAAVRSEMRNTRTDLADEIRALRTDMKADSQRIHEDIKLLTGKVYELMAREH